MANRFEQQPNELIITEISACVGACSSPGCVTCHATRLDKSLLHIQVKKIKFSQNSISDRFKDYRIEDTYQQLLDGNITPDKLPRIEVVDYEGHRWCLSGHRRLFLYKRVNEIKEIDASICVEFRRLDDPAIKKRFAKRRTTKDGGESVAVVSTTGDKKGQKKTKLMKNLKTIEEA